MISKPIDLQQILEASFSLPGIPPKIEQTEVDRFLDKLALIYPLLLRAFLPEMLHQNPLFRTVNIFLVEALLKRDRAEIEANEAKWTHFFDQFQPSDIVSLDNRTEQQYFQEELLKRGYEQFVAKLDPKTRDRDGVWYTPDPIIRFMVNGCETQLEQIGYHWGNTPGVIIDPACGIACFLTCVLRRTPKEYLDDRYINDWLRGNDIDLMACFLGRLNMENTYYQLTGKFQPFYGIRCVDTLSNENNVSQMSLALSI